MQLRRRRLGRGSRGSEGTNVLPRLMPASRLRATQGTAYLVSDRVVSLNHDLLSWNGARFNNSLYDGWRGGGGFKKKGKKNWNQMVRFHIGPGRLLGDSIPFAVHPARGTAARSPRLPNPPSARPLRPGAAVFKLSPSGRERRGRLRAGASGGAEGVLWGRGGVGDGRREGGKAKGAEKDNPRLGGK